MDEIQCKTCSKTFRPNQSGRKYCGLRCSQLAQRTLPESRLCAHCGRVFAPRKSTHWFCGYSCSNTSAVAHPHERDPLPEAVIAKRASDRFWAHVRKGDGCWEWTGSLFASGYGYFTIRSHPIRAHRFAWEHHFGDIPVGLQVCHHCDNRKCVRPEHLFLGTQTMNMRDMLRKGRRKSSFRPRRLTDADVAAIRALVSSGVSRARVATRYDIDSTHAGRIVARKRWPAKRGAS